jgi:hypothetical protein
MTRLVNFKSPGLYFRMTDADRVTDIRSPSGTMIPVPCQAPVADATTARTLSNDDNGRTIVFSNGSAVSVTVPAGLVSGFTCELVQAGAGAVTVVAGSSTTVSKLAAVTLVLAGQWAAARVVNRGTNTYTVTGQLTAV